MDKRTIRSVISCSQVNSTQTYLSKYIKGKTRCMSEARFDLEARIMPSTVGSGLGVLGPDFGLRGLNLSLRAPNLDSIAPILCPLAPNLDPIAQILAPEPPILAPES